MRRSDAAMLVEPSIRRWPIAALRSAAGLDPDEVPLEESAGVPAHLVGTGRASSRMKVIKAGECAEVKADLLSQAP